MKILAAVDGSAFSTHMLEGLCAHSAWFREAPTLTLVYVHLALPYKRAVAWVGKEAVHQYYEEESEAALAPAREVLAKLGVAFTVEKRVGDPAAEITRLAREGGFDLIAMGTHGHGGLTGLVMGSVTTKVIASSTIPVLLFK